MKARVSTGEAKLFSEIRNERPHECAICQRYIQEARTRCFAHILPKGKFKNLRLCKFNILLVCSLNCHQEVDRCKKGSENELEQFINETQKRHDENMKKTSTV